MLGLSVVFAGIECSVCWDWVLCLLGLGVVFVGIGCSVCWD